LVTTVAVAIACLTAREDDDGADKKISIPEARTVNARGIS
jgi:hypothetical protein